MGDVMGKVGKSYPRFEVVGEPGGADEDSKSQARLGAFIGVLGALGLIVWLMAVLVR
jgi:hypothetical protein